MIDSNKDKECERNHKIVEQLDKSYIGTVEHISDCDVCSFLQPIMESKK